MKRDTAGLIALLVLVTAQARANDFKAMAKELSSAARDAHIERVAVMPFTAADESSDREGWNIAERLVTQLVRVGKVKTVERALLRKIFDEHSLGQTGALETATLKKLGKVDIPSDVFIKLLR